MKNGLYEAFNLAIRNSERKKILFLHSDDLLLNTQTLIADVYNSTSDVVFYGVKIEGTYLSRKWHIKNLSSINVSSMIIPPHAGILVSRNVYCKIGKFNTDSKREDVVKAQNYYCENQQKNPHTPRVMQSLGLPDEDIKLFCADNLFPIIK